VWLSSGVLASSQLLVDRAVSEARQLHSPSLHSLLLASQLHTSLWLVLYSHTSHPSSVARRSLQPVSATTPRSSAPFPSARGRRDFVHMFLRRATVSLGHLPCHNRQAIKPSCHPVRTRARIPFGPSQCGMIERICVCVCSDNYPSTYVHTERCASVHTHAHPATT